MAKLRTEIQRIFAATPRKEDNARRGQLFEDLLCGVK